MPEIPLAFPVKGVHQGMAYNQTPDGYSPDALNVMTFDPDRARGGQRPGTSKFLGTQINSSNPVQAIEGVTFLDDTATVDTINAMAPSVSPANVTSIGFAPDSTGTTYILTDKANGTANFFKVSDDFLEAYGVYVNGAFGNSNVPWDNPMWVSGDGAYAAWAGVVNAGVANVTVVNTSDGSLRKNLLATGSFTYRQFSVTDTATGFRLVAVSASNNFLVVDYDSSANTLTETASGTTAGTVTDCWIGSEDTSVFYTMDNLTIDRRLCATGAVVWQHTHSITNAQNITGNNAGKLYASCAQFGSPQRNLYRYTIGASGLTQDFIFDTGTASNQMVVAPYDNTNILLVSFGATLHQVKAIDVSTAAPFDLYTVGHQDRNGASNGTITSIIYDLGDTEIYLGALGGGYADFYFKVRSGNAGEKTRETKLVAVSGGNTYTLTRNTINTWVKTAVGVGTLVTGKLSVTGLGAFGKVFLVDGTNYRVVDPSGTPSDTNWSTLMTTGTLPASGANKARLIELYRGRVTLSGVKGDDQNIFFLKVGDPFVNNVLPVIPDGLEAVALNSSEAGRIGDIVNAMIPYSDDLMVIGGDHTINVLRGDPSPINSGQIDLITDVTGMWFGRPWTMAPNGELYFMGTDAVYRMLISGDQVSRPEPLSTDRISGAVHDLDPSQKRAKLMWDSRLNGLWVFLTSHASSVNQHWFWSRRLNEWWPVQFPNNHGPICAYALDGDSPNDRVVLLGGRTGYIQKINPSVKDDDGTAINSYVTFSPIRLAGEDLEQSIRKIAVTLGGNTDSVGYEVRVGDDVESALSSPVIFSGTLTGGGRKSSVRSRARGNVILFKLLNSSVNSAWTYESGSAVVEARGMVRV